MRPVLSSLFLLLAFYATTQCTPSVSFDQWLSLRMAGVASISPDGKHVPCNVTRTNWKDNNYDTEISRWRNGEAPNPANARWQIRNAGFTQDS